MILTSSFSGGGDGDDGSSSPVKPLERKRSKKKGVAPSDPPVVELGSSDETAKEAPARVGAMGKGVTKEVTSKSKAEGKRPSADYVEVSVPDPPTSPPAAKKRKFSQLLSLGKESTSVVKFVFDLTIVPLQVFRS